MVRIVDCESDLTTVGTNVAEGSVVIFPTDTVYGLGTNPSSQAGVERCFDMKHRDFGKHMPVLFDSIESASEFVRFNAPAYNLAEKYWPGKLTIILPLKDVKLPTQLVGAGGTLATRIPSHECCIKLISKCGGSLVGTSANISGNPPFIDPNDPNLREFSKASDYFLIGECGKDRIPSTVIDLCSPASPKIVREGAIAASDILDYFEKTSSTDLSNRIGTI